MFVLFLPSAQPKGALIGAEPNLISIALFLALMLYWQDQKEKAILAEGKEALVGRYSALLGGSHRQKINGVIFDRKKRAKTGGHLRVRGSVLTQDQV